MSPVRRFSRLPRQRIPRNGHRSREADTKSSFWVVFQKQHDADDRRLAFAMKWNLDPGIASRGEIHAFLSQRSDSFENLTAEKVDAYEKQVIEYINTTLPKLGQNDFREAIRSLR